LQLRVLRLGLLKDGNVWVGGFPEREEILIRGPGLRRIALQNVGAPELQMRQGSDGFVQHDSPMIEDLLKLCGSFPATVSRKKGFSAHINGIQIRPVVTTKSRQTQLIRSSDPKNIDRLLRVCTKERNLCAKSRQVIQLQERIFGKPLAQIICQGARSVRVPCIGKGQ